MMRSSKSPSVAWSLAEVHSTALRAASTHLGIARRARAGEIKETDGGRAVGARVFRIVLVQSVPPDAAAKFVVPTTEDEASGFLGATEISPIMGALKGFKEGDDDQGVVVVILIVHVAAGRRRFVSRDGTFG